MRGYGRSLPSKLQAMDPEGMACRWGEVLGRPVTVDARPSFRIELHRGSLRFVPGNSRESEGVSGFDLEVSDLPAPRANAVRRGLHAEAGNLRLCGVRIRLLEVA